MRCSSKKGAKMTNQAEPIFDLAHLAHIELLTPKLEESTHFFVDVMGMYESGRKLKNRASRYSDRGVGLRRLDHVNLLKKVQRTSAPGKLLCWRCCLCGQDDLPEEKVRCTCMKPQG
jgi:hypothetical protein